NIEFLAKGGFGKVYTIRTRGEIIDWNVTKNDFVRQPKKVVLKVFDGDDLPRNESFQENQCGDLSLASNIVCGLRPSVIPGTPKTYADLMYSTNVGLMLAVNAFPRGMLPKFSE
ncbi:7215_t:CDS:2, partial [Racocetra persica]